MTLGKLTGFKRFWYEDGVGGPMVPGIALEAGADFLTDASRGQIPGVDVLCGFGERTSVGTTATGEDVWPGTVTTVPTPADAGVGMSVTSSSAEDGAGTNTGVLTLLVDFLDADGNPGSEVVTMNGTGTVNLVERNVRFVQFIHAVTVGSNGVAVGDITIHLTGTAAAVYCQIAAGGNLSLTIHRMVPLGKKLVLNWWHATESAGKQVALRLRTTSRGAVVYPGVFLFKDSMFLMSDSNSTKVVQTIPALAIVKASGWGESGGPGKISCSWIGALFPE